MGEKYSTLMLSTHSLSLFPTSTLFHWSWSTSQVLFKWGLFSGEIRAGLMARRKEEESWSLQPPLFMLGLRRGTQAWSNTASPIFRNIARTIEG